MTLFIILGIMYGAFCLVFAAWALPVFQDRHRNGWKAYDKFIDALADQALKEQDVQKLKVHPPFTKPKSSPHS